MPDKLRTVPEIAGEVCSRLGVTMRGSSVVIEPILWAWVEEILQEYRNELLPPAFQLDFDKFLAFRRDLGLDR